MSYDVWTTDRLVPPIDSMLLPCNVGYQRVRHSDYPTGMVHPGCIAVPGMGSGHKNTSCTSVPFVKVTEPVIDTTTPPITADITDPAPCTQVLRRRPPLPNFLPIQKQQIQTDADSSHEVSPPVTLQTILFTVSQSEQFQVRDRHRHGNAGLSYFPMGSLTSPVLPLVTSEIGTQIPSLRSPIELLNYAAELKRAHDDGADNVEALEEALGFLKHFSEHVCASTKSETSPQTSEDVSSSSPSPIQDTNCLQLPSVGDRDRCQNGREARPKSFLRDEVDEFNEIFSELLSFSPYRKFTDYLGDSQGTDSDPGVEIPTSEKTELSLEADNMEGVRYKNLIGARSCDHRLCDRCKGGASGASGGAISPNKHLPRVQSCPCGQSLSESRSSPQPPPDTGQGSSPGGPAGPRPNSTLWDENDKLFTQLLDDLDNITGDTASVRRRKKAREMFSNWLFSEDPKSPETSPAGRYKEVMRSLVKTRSVEIPESKQELFSKWRPRSYEYISEDDADSGYHTASSTLQSRGRHVARRPPGEWTLTREDLRCNIECFNNNNHGLIMSLQSDTNTFQGFIRVHMNLIRPINMSLSTRPASIYDVMGQSEDEDECDQNQITSFYLPKDTTKVIHINSDTTTQEVIKALLSKFKITDNPRKFALYEKVQEADKATMRRLEEEEMPLPLCLSWTKEGILGLDKRKFILQENDTGEIMWEAFSLPELENFLKILNREEEEYVEQVRGKYRMLKIHMERRLKELGLPETTLSGDKRTPVFV